MAWVVAALAVASALAYILSKDTNQPRCPYCKSFVKKYARLVGNGFVKNAKRFFQILKKKMI